MITFVVELFFIFGGSLLQPVKAASFAETIDAFSMSTEGKRAADLGFSSGANWCGYYARYVLENVYAQFGYDVRDFIPYDSLARATLTANSWKSGVYGDYYSWTSWSYNGDSSSNRTSNLDSCRPKPGDIVLMETYGGTADGPDHVGIIVNSDPDNGYFITAEGNTGSGNTSTRVVRFYDYFYNNSTGYYYRSGSSSCIVHAVCSIRYPGLEPVANQSPNAALDVIEGGVGTVKVAGWAFDPDNPSQSLGIHVYLQDEDGEMHWAGALEANQERPDVHEAYGCGLYHGFGGLLSTNGFYGTCTPMIAALDSETGGAGATWKDRGQIVISADTTPPTISNVNITPDLNGYTVTCEVIDSESGVDRVLFPTWTAYNDQDDLLRDWGESPAARGTLNGNSVTFRVNRSEHNNEYGAYYTHIYVYDRFGNENWAHTGFNYDYTVSFNANGGTVEQASKTVHYQNTYGTLPTPFRAGYIFLGWFTSVNGGTQIKADTKFTITTNQSIYAHWEKSDEESPVVTGGTLEILSDTLCRFTVTATDNIGVDHVDIHTWYGDYPGDGDTVYKAIKLGNDWYYDVPCNLTNSIVRWMDARVFDASGNQALVSGSTILVGKLEYVDITFDANEGFCNLASKKVIWAEHINRLEGSTYVSNYGQLPIPERRGYSFAGWYTEQTGGTKVEESTPVTRNESHTLYAHWNKIEPDFILPAALTTIEEEAFMNAAFTYTVLPETCTTIGSRAFAYCPNLKHIYIPEATIAIATDAFEGVTGLIIHGADGSWAEFYAGKRGFAFVVE